MNLTRSDCLCGSGLSYDRCCGLYHSGTAVPDEALVLMRARFTAYARRNVDFLESTWVKEKCPEKIDFSKENAAWIRLEIIQIKKGKLKDQKGLVEFKAYFLTDGEEFALHEISRFIKQNGRWFYLDGAVKSIAKVGSHFELGRNAPCPCGSGKKYKRCCAAD